ncbi:MAG TPA: hypothetical protein VNY36_09565 [Bacteroidia bacterium]|jgi:hypothetical protein|nr:hypothetical protein [Bacteroidia bacterium]
MKNIIRYIFLFASIIIVSCDKTMPPSEYVKYVENPENGLKIKREVNGVGYILQYQPTEYCVMLEKRSFSIPLDIFKEEYNRFKGLEHYTLRIDKSAMDSLVDKLGDTSKYKKTITEYFDFKIQKDIKLIEGSDTIPCALCEVDAGLTGSYTFSLGFPNKNNEPQSAQKSDKIILYQNKFLNTGNVILCVKGKDVKNIPALKMM